MKKFTKSLLTLVLLVLAVGGAKAQDVETEVSADMFHTWQGYDADAVITGDADVEINYGIALGGGNVVCGTGSVFNTVYADLTGGSKLVCEGTKGLVLRVMLNRQADNSLVEKYITIDEESGKAELDLKGFSYVHLNAIKINWGASGTVTTVKLVKPADPYEVPKAALKAAMDKAKLQNSFAKTTESWNALQDAISAGAKEYADPTSTDALNSATLAIENAVAGLKLTEGYVNVTKSMFHEWSGIEDDATIVGAGGCDLVIGSSIGEGGMLYGNSSVKWNQYAKIVNPKSLIILGTPAGITFGARTDRLEVGNGGGDDNGGSLVTINLTIDENGKALADLSDKASIRINAIKNGWGAGSATVTDLLVEYKPVDVTVTNAGYATFSSELNTKVSGTKAYAAKVNGNKVVLTEVTEIPAGSGVIVETEGSYQFPVLNEAEAIVDNDLLVSDGSVVGDGSIYVLNNVGGKVGFYKLANGNKLEAGKAYLKLENSARGFIGIEEATGINEVNVNKAAVKTGKIYNLNGQIVSKPSKGLFIVDGKVVSF